MPIWWRRDSGERKGGVCVMNNALTWQRRQNWTFELVKWSIKFCRCSPWVNVCIASDSVSTRLLRCLLCSPFREGKFIDISLINNVLFHPPATHLQLIRMLIFLTWPTPIPADVTAVLTPLMQCKLKELIGFGFSKLENLWQLNRLIDQIKFACSWK